jgi:hypothetical protein
MNKLLLGLSNARITQLLGRGAVVRGIRHNLQVLTEVLQTEATKMEHHIEKKCRGAEGIILTQTQEQINQHFLSVGLDSSQNCGD